MKNKKLRASVLLLVAVFLTVLPARFDTALPLSSSEAMRSKISGKFVLSYIHINDSSSNNWSYMKDTFAWCSGNGSFKNPYIIQDCVINATNSPTENGILIENSKNAYFVIQNCSMFNAGGEFNDFRDISGIKLVNTHNGAIENCSVYDNKIYGITLRSCANITIFNNTIFDNHHGIWMPQSVDNFIINNTIINNDGDGLAMVKYSAEQSDTGNVVKGNTINNNYYSMIVMGGCNYNFISHNTIVGNEFHVRLESKYNVFSNNLVNNTKNSGVASWDRGNTIVNNTINYCTWGYGLWISHWGSEFINNTLIGNRRGIRISTGGNHTVSNNVIKNSTFYGIRVGWSEGNLILNNTIRYSNTTGILLEHSTNNEIKYNIVTESTDYCIYVDAECSNNIFEGNSCLPYYEIINNGQIIVGFPIEFVVLIFALTSMVYLWRKKRSHIF